VGRLEKRSVSKRKVYHSKPKGSVVYVLRLPNFYNEVAIMLLYLVMVARKTDGLKHDPKRYRKY
jgi:hypothetical protein